MHIHYLGVIMSKVDVQENLIIKIDKELLTVLLMDRSSSKHIIWATNDYAYRGEKYYATEQITVPSITGHNGRLIKPRIEKSQKEQLRRIRNKAEVFTPSWICNKQNNLVDNAWFGQDGVFNIENDNGWTATTDKIIFPTAEGKTWQDYVKDVRLEVSCGEAPYLASRYDTVTGNPIAIKERIGLLDRKLRVVSENTDDEQSWYIWTKEAYKSIYGFDWQGDNVLLARENLLFTFVDNYVERFKTPISKEYLKEIAEILSWNIWQMDGMKYVIPNSCKPSPKLQTSLFDEEENKECEGCKKGDNRKHRGIYCKIKDWETNKTVKFVSLINKK